MDPVTLFSQWNSLLLPNKAVIGYEWDVGYTSQYSVCLLIQIIQAGQVEFSNSLYLCTYYRTMIVLQLCLEPNKMSSSEWKNTL